ncbi:MAG: DDE-type integrase/transposase/recombinase [Deltaproteobacteria bacterium]|nr:DDE-type integrase/transposase/recombinase [Deltaproteobacteria bacterium]
MHVCVDDHSRLAYAELRPDEKAITATCFLIRAAAWLGHHGITVRRVMTHNGSCYRAYLFDTAGQSLGARQARPRPCTPRTNGKAERFIQSSIKERAYKRAYQSSEKRPERLGPWLGYYNQARPHSALNYKPPISRLENCEQRPAKNT